MAVNINIPKPIIDYNDLDNKPTLVTAHSELNLDDGTNPHGTTASDVGALPMPTGTTSQYLRGDGSLETFPTIPNPANFVAKADYTPAHSVLVQQSGTGSPTSVQIGTNEFLGRKSGGGANIEGLSVSEAKSILNYTTAEINDSADKRYVTDAQLTVIGNTSGTNTGDQDLSGLVPTSRNITINGVTQDLSADRTFTIASGITVGTTAITSGTDGRVFFQAGGVIQQDGAFFWDNTNKILGVGATPNTAVRLDVRAQGALSTDIAFRVRNSADTANLFEVQGNGVVFARGTGNILTNASFGEFALDANTTGVENTVFGYRALSSITSGNGSSAFGSSALFLNTGSDNNAFGAGTLFNNTSGVRNNAFGSGVFLSLTSGSDNSAFGHRAGRFIADGATANATSNQSVFLGSLTKALADNQTNQIVIGHNAIGNGSNTVTLGNTSIVATYLQGQVKVGTFASSPTGIEGAIYYDSVTKKHYGFNGTTWNAFY